MASRHQLSCQRCGKPFSATRLDAKYCSRSCRRGKSPALLPVENAPATVAEEEDEEDMHGWRRMPGGVIVPPPDSRHIFRIDGWLE